MLAWLNMEWKETYYLNETNQTHNSIHSGQRYGNTIWKKERKKVKDESLKN